MEVGTVLLSIEQSHNLGNYQSLKVALSLEAVVQDGEDTSVVVSALKLKIYEEMHQIIMMGVHRHKNRLRLIEQMEGQGVFDVPMGDTGVETPF